MGKKDRLKNGLDALFEDNFQEKAENTVEKSDSVKMVRVSLLEPNKNQPRQEFDKDKLMESAKAYGKSPYGEHLKAVAEGRFIY